MFSSSEATISNNSIWTFEKNVTLFLDAFPCKMSLPLKATHLFKYGLIACFSCESSQEMSSEELESFFRYGDSYPILLQDEHNDKSSDPFVVLTKIKNKESRVGAVTIVFEAIHYDQCFVQLLAKYSSESV